MGTFAEFVVQREQQSINEFLGWGQPKTPQVPLGKRNPYDKVLGLLDQINQALGEIPGVRIKPESLERFRQKIEMSRDRANQGFAGQWGAEAEGHPGQFKDVGGNPKSPSSYPSIQKYLKPRRPEPEWRGINTAAPNPPQARRPGIVNPAFAF